MIRSCNESLYLKCSTFAYIQSLLNAIEITKKPPYVLFIHPGDTWFHKR